MGLYSGEDGAVQQLGCISPDSVTVEIKGGLPVYLISHVNGRQTTHTTDDVLHIRMPVSLDGILGASPIQLCREALGLNPALVQESSALIAKRARHAES